MITIIAAAAENNALGKDGELIWHLPDDFKRFKRLTTGHHIIMGRKTYESFPEPLPNRKHIIITRQEDYKTEGAHIVHDLDAALEHSKDQEHVFIIGGGEIYKMALDKATHIELTRVHSKFEADTYFPEIPEASWKISEKVFHPSDEKHEHSFSYISYVRK